MELTDLNWKTWIKQGDQYLKADTPKNGVHKFNPEIRYNVLSMALEAYVMAILDFHDSLPDNHTYTDLIYALEKVVPIDERLKKQILDYENIQSICSIEKYHRTAPTSQELAVLKEAIIEISEMAHNICITEEV